MARTNSSIIPRDQGFSQSNAGKFQDLQATIKGIICGVFRWYCGGGSQTSYSTSGMSAYNYAGDWRNCGNSHNGTLQKNSPFFSLLKSIT